MNIDLPGRRAVVTGSTAGIGRATAEGPVRAGAEVVVDGRGSARVDEAVRQMRHAFPGHDISGVAADLSSAEGAAAFPAQARHADILVNNLGTAWSASSPEHDRAFPAGMNAPSGCTCGFGYGRPDSRPRRDLRRTSDEAGHFA